MSSSLRSSSAPTRANTQLDLPRASKNAVAASAQASAASDGAERIAHRGPTGSRPLPRRRRLPLRRAARSRDRVAPGSGRSHRGSRCARSATSVTVALLSPRCSCGSRRTARRAPAAPSVRPFSRAAPMNSRIVFGVRAERAQLGAGTNAGAQSHRVHLAMHHALVELQQLDRHRSRCGRRPRAHALSSSSAGYAAFAQPSSAASTPVIESPVSIISIALRMPRNHGWKCMSGTPKRTAG